jgi:GNAT superfamily N-acetyltransferase
VSLPAIPQTAPWFEQSFRVALEAIRSCVPNPDRTECEVDDDALHFELLGRVDYWLELATQAYCAAWGSRVAWKVGAPIRECTLKPQVHVIDMDNPAGAIRWQHIASSFDGRDHFYDGGFYAASRAYRAECGWDFAPENSGTWICAIAPTSLVGSGEETYARGLLQGFVIVHDRNDDDKPESIAHAWVASGYRRRGVARTLMREAYERFEIEQIEGPATEAGRRLVWAVAPRAGRA